jgi:RNA polymerase sigma-70 factor (ECF subfamily)
VERLLQRDPDALRELYDRWARVTFGYLLHATGDRNAAEDAQQQVFLDVWRGISSYDPDRGSLLTWVMAIARNRAIDERRRRVPEPAGSADNVAVLEPAAVADEPEVLAERWRIASLLAMLHREEAEILRLRFYDDLTQTEIAESLGIPLGTVKMRMVSGLRRLRDLIGETT